MTTPRPPPHGPAPTLRPFRQQPQRWDRQQDRALRDGHICCGADCAKGCEPVLIRERTGWGWIDWTVPADGSLPQQPDRIAVFSPATTRAQRLGLRWLARRPAYRIRLGPLALRPATAAVTVLALITATLATLHGDVPLGITVPAAALAPLLVEHLPDVLDARAGENVRIIDAGIDAGPACRYLHRLSALQTALTDAAARSDQYQVRRAQEVGHHQLFDTADLLQRRDTRSVSGVLITRERLMLQLVAQTAETLTPTADDAPCTCSGLRLCTARRGVRRRRRASGRCRYRAAFLARGQPPARAGPTCRRAVSPMATGVSTDGARQVHEVAVPDKGPLLTPSDEFGRGDAGRVPHEAQLPRVGHWTEDGAGAGSRSRGGRRRDRPRGCEEQPTLR